jgi:hypothetical protein
MTREDKFARVELLYLPATLSEARFPKRRSPIGLPPPTPFPSLNPSLVLPIFPFAPVGITEIGCHVTHLGLANFRTRSLGLP